MRSLTNLGVDAAWPENLPWIQFSRSHAGTILKSIDFSLAATTTAQVAVAGPQPHRSLSLLARQGYEILPPSDRALIFSAVFEQVVRKSLSIAMGSEELAMQLFARKSVDRITKQFDLVIPETYPNENLHRATTLVGRRSSDVQAELVQILLYLISNRLLVNQNRYDIWWGNDVFADDRLIISLCRMSGLATPTAIRNLTTLSRTSPTMRAVVDALFVAAVHAEAADLVGLFLAADSLAAGRRIDINSLHTPVLSGITPLLFAVARGSAALTTVLLDAGASIREPPCIMMAAAILAPAASLSRQVVKLLMERGVATDGCGIGRKGGLSALHGAILIGDKNLIRSLVKAGFDLNYRSIDLRMVLITDMRFSLDEIGSLGLAASFVNRQGAAKHEGSFSESQRRALELCQELIEGYDTQILLLHD